MLVSVNEMLKLQLADLLTNLNFLQHHLNSFGQNVSILKNKLPDMSQFSKTQSVEPKSDVPLRINIDESEETDKTD
jgi:hypothetical protein